MGKGIDKILGFMKLGDSEYSEEDEFEEFDEDLDEEEEEEETPTRGSSRSSSRKSSRDSYDDIEDEEAPARGGFFHRSSSGSSLAAGTSRFGRSSKVVPMSGRSARGGMEVCVVRPVDFESYSQEISDIILENKAAIINFEDVKNEGDSQRLIDFISGCCYAIDGSVRQIAENIVVVAPNDIDISGDYLEENGGGNIELPGFDEDEGEESLRSYEM